MNEKKKENNEQEFDPYVLDDSFKEALTYEKVFGKDHK